MKHHVFNRMDTYLHNTYKEFLRAYIADSTQKGPVSRIATMCGCDRTYLSQVLNGKADLTPDHLIQLCDALDCSEMESRYLLLLLLRDRASALAARRSFQRKIDKLKREAQELSGKIISKESPTKITETQRNVYYSSWIYAATHSLTSIPAFQTVPALSEKLNVPADKMARTLKALVEMGVITEQKNVFKHNGQDVYLPRESSQTTSHHWNWRMKAIERAQEEEDIHYTVAFSISQSDLEKLRNQVLQLIDKQRSQVRASGTDIACVFCCDFFVL